MMRILTIIAMLMMAACSHSTAPDAGALSAAEARALAAEAYVVAYAPIQNYAKQSARAFDKSNVNYQGTNKLYNFPLLIDYYSAQIAGVPSPNHDTLYSSGVIDLRNEPVVVSAGAVSDPNRYYSLQLLDLDTDVLPYISTLTNANRGGHYLVLGPDNAVPTDTSGFTGVIHSPSRIVTILGRVEAFNDADQVNAALVQQGFKIQTLSSYQGTAAPPSNAPDLPAYDAASAQGLGYLQYANLVFGLQPPEASDPALAARLARIHVGSNQTFSATEFPQDVQDAISRGLNDGAAAVRAASLTHSVMRNGWSSVDPSVMSDNGSFGNDYLARAAVAYALIYMNTRAEAWYGLAYVDGAGAALDGAHDYTLHFAANEVPPSKFFWSVTAYDATTHLFFNSPTQRYSIGSNTSGLQYNADGSLDIPIQASAPTGSAAALANWLPVDTKPFYLIIRSYGPGPGILNGTWVPPPVLRTP
ncbi:MAG: DUF1254 domain-containing protein [Nevskiaceae bacterium]|nr:MAG: DUF1254 domain-containing protein [Nevskiaceae bacterium]